MSILLINVIFSGAVNMPISGELRPPYDTKQHKYHENINCHESTNTALCFPLNGTLHILLTMFDDCSEEAKQSKP
jgi:hypothetical protein